MSRNERLVLIALALAVAVAAVLLLGLEGEEPSKRARDRAGDSPPAPAPAGGDAGDGTRGQAPPPAARPEIREQLIRIERGGPVGGVKEISVGKGEIVRLVVTGDVTDEVHVHGYDLTQPVAPGRAARFRFRADIDGIFTIELENAGREIAKLDVRT